MVVVLIGTLTTLMLGIDETSWAVQAPSAQQQNAQREEVLRRLATMRRGSSVQVERQDRTKFYAVLQDIGPDSITVLREEGKNTTSEVIPVTSIRQIRAVSPQKVAKGGHKGLIIAAVVAGVLVAGLVGSCRSASTALSAPASAPGGAGM
jgi:hypothetical protein